ncbi:MAG TPA: GlsB/YeaQ/YmgE family stress response membrane protein [Archangium sp.]|jgi:uncharacterized membrane protein YeaQ/YmgE (transglycosylase-associated protein family)|uniref:GlsB/YeaQ/YmgE family stress response membrane protein n=1 Tax=Archangium sp. TaxID=1872627 RepID=UPI002ED980C9
MSVFAYIVVGLIVGVIMRAILPPAPQVGFWGSVLLGSAGGIIAGLISSAFAPSSALSIVHPLGIVLAVILAALLSVGANVVTHRRRFG